jgi:hypothetical protein
MDMKTLLGAIGSQEESTFSEICDALGDDRPAKGDRAAWREFFQLIDEADKKGFINAIKLHGNFEGAILTADGVAELRRS